MFQHYRYYLKYSSAFFISFSSIKDNLMNHLCIKAAMVKRIPTVNPMSYRMPDLWKSSSSTSLHESSVFKSRTKRLDYEDPMPPEEVKFRRSLERDRGRNLGRSVSPSEDANLRNNSNFQSDGLHLGESGMQNVDEDYLVSSSQLEGGTSHVFNTIDPNIRNVSRELGTRYETSLMGSRGVESPSHRVLRGSTSPTSRSRAHSPGRPISPTQDIIAHSRQKGFAFGGAELSYNNTNDDSYKVFVREQSEGEYTIRPVGLLLTYNATISFCLKAIFGLLKLKIRLPYKISWTEKSRFIKKLKPNYSNMQFLYHAAHHPISDGMHRLIRFQNLCLLLLDRMTVCPPVHKLLINCHTRKNSLKNIPKMVDNEVLRINFVIFTRPQ